MSLFKKKEILNDPAIPQIPWDELVVGDKIGVGASAIVCNAIWQKYCFSSFSFPLSFPPSSFPFPFLSFFLSPLLFSLLLSLPFLSPLLSSLLLPLSLSLSPTLLSLSLFPSPFPFPSFSSLLPSFPPLSFPFQHYQFKILTRKGKKRKSGKIKAVAIKQLIHGIKDFDEGLIQDFLKEIKLLRLVFHLSFPSPSPSPLPLSPSPLSLSVPANIYAKLLILLPPFPSSLPHSAVRHKNL